MLLFVNRHVPSSLQQFRAHVAFRSQLQVDLVRAKPVLGDGVGEIGDDAGSVGLDQYVLGLEIAVSHRGLALSSVDLRVQVQQAVGGAQAYVEHLVVIQRLR